MGSTDTLLGWIVEGEASGEDLMATARRSIAPASALSRRLRDEGEIARGARTSIRRGRDLRLNRPVAVKILDPRRVRGVRDIARFLEEARVVAALAHPNIPAVHDLGKDDEGTNYYTMDLLEGRTLHQVTRGSDYVPGRESCFFPALEALLAAAQAAAHARRAGVAHGDLRPANILLGPHGTTTVLSWGAVRPISDAAKELMDTAARAADAAWDAPPHMEGARLPEADAVLAPELAGERAAGVSERLDVFYLGACLWQILTARPLYDAASPDELRALAAAAAVPDPRRVLPAASLPPALCELSLRCLARDPAQRPADAEAFERELREFVLGAGRATVRSYLPGSLLVKQGDAGDAAFVLLEGRCTVFKTVDGTRHVLRELGPGDVFGETAVFAEVPRTASVEAKEAVRAGVITRASLQAELGRTYWVGQILHALAARFREVDERATRLEREALGAAADRTILEAMVRAQKTVVPWNPLRVSLIRRFRLTAAEAVALVQQRDWLSLDPATDTLEWRPKA